MLGLFDSPKNVPSRSRRATLRVECLEDRDCPATISLNADVMPGQMVKLSGYVTGEDVGGLQVNFSGSVEGFTMTDSTGYYSYATSSATLGFVYAVAVNSEFESTNIADAAIDVMPPDITFQIISVMGNDVWLKGNVSSIDAGSFAVEFSGAASGSVMPNQAGEFELMMTAYELGTLNAHATDLWGQMDYESAEVVNNQPVIQNFTATYDDSYVWILRGQVIDEWAEGLTVYFGGIPSLEGHSVTVGADGWFEYYWASQPGEDGTATVVVTDWWGVESEEDCVVIIA